MVSIMQRCLLLCLEFMVLWEGRYISPIDINLTVLMQTCLAHMVLLLTVFSN